MSAAIHPSAQVWSIAGNDSGGGAGLSADQRAAAALGVHLCPVVAAITAQNTCAVTRVQPVSADLLDAQLAALAADLPADWPQATGHGPRLVIKTGLLGSPDLVAVVALWVDALRLRGPVALVVDPVLGASTGASFANAATVAAYRRELLPRATLITPNVAEAARLLDCAAPTDLAEWPVLARGLHLAGAQAVCITGGDSPDHQGLVLDWISTPHASGWLALPRVATAHHHGTGCTLASSAAAALALGFVAADALVLAKMATTHALQGGYATGLGRGPVAARSGLARHPAQLPQLTWGEALELAPPLIEAAAPVDLGLYAIVDSAERVAQVLQAGVRTVQLRIKTPAQPDAAWRDHLAEAIRLSVAACQPYGAQLYINDHWQLAHELGASAIHLGQEDLQALGESGRAALRATGLQLGISSHSLWELARARTLAPAYIACGPVWPTLTKDMPWLPQGLDNLSWWVAMAGTPVVAIGGILTPEQATQAARSGASAVCIVRGLGADPAQTVPTWQRAIAQGRAAARPPQPALPHASLTDHDAAFQR